MHIFEIRSGQEAKATVFARSHDQAAQLFMAWRMLNGIEVPEPMEVFEHHPQGTQRHADKALSLGVAGIGYYDPHAGWTIVPPERFEEIA